MKAQVAHSMWLFYCQHTFMKCLLCVSTVGPPYSRVLQIQPTQDQKKYFFNSKKFQKTKLEFAACLATLSITFAWHLHSTDIEWGIISNLEMI